MKFLILIYFITFIIILESKDTQNHNISDPLDEILYVCNKKPAIGDACFCRGDYGIDCYDAINPLKTANIKILNATFILKDAYLRLDVDTLKKDKILPGREHTVERLYLSLLNTKNIEGGALDKFTNLTKLDISSSAEFGVENNLVIDDHALTKNVGSRLKELKISFGSKTISPTTFQYLTHLTNLSLEQNYGISPSLSKELFSKSLNNLLDLELSFCNISSLDDDVFINLENLVYLDLSSNPLTSIPKAINSLKKLDFLDFDKTEIEVLKNNNFTVNENLKRLEMRNSRKLFSIEDCAFCSFPNLEKLYLMDNKKLERIHENAFGALIGRNMSNLKVFRVEDSSITLLPEKLLDWEAVKEIRVDNNPFVCNCSMAWLINDFANPKPKYYKNLRGAIPFCQSPAELKGHSFQDVAGTICMETNVIVDNRIVVCDNSSDDTSPCTCYQDQLRCRDFVTFQSRKSVTTNLKIKDKNFILKYVTFHGIPIFSLKKGKILRGSEHTIESLEFIDTSVSKIEDKIFDNFISLKTLKIMDNNIEALNDNFLTSKIATTLSELNLEKNQFKSVSTTSFQHLKNLQSLSLSKNRQINDFLTKKLFSSSLSNLKYLHLQWCNIHQLEEDVFENLINLEYLELSRNPITTIPKALNPLSKLESLDISKTDIEVFTNNSLNIFKHVDNLDMHSMQKLTSIEDCAFCIFPNLETLAVAVNPKLERIHENAFGAIDGTNIPKLRWFSAISCSLSTLSEHLINWNTIKSVEIAENPFICNCSMAWLINDFAYSNPKYVNKIQVSYFPHYHNVKNKVLQCAGPSELKGKTFREISNKLCNTSFTQIGIFDSAIQEHKNEKLNYFIVASLIAVSILGMALCYYFSCAKKSPLSNAEVAVPEESERLNEEVPLNEL